MPELTREEKIKLVEKLPQGLRDFLYSEDTGAFLLYLGEKYNLDDEKISLLSKIVGNVILGIMPITSLAQEISSKIATDSQAAMNLAQELYTGLLAPVMAPLKTQTPAAPAVPPAQIPSSDKYRESTTMEPAPTFRPPASEVGAPTPAKRDVGEIVDLRKTPPPPLQMPVSTAPAFIPVKPAPPKPLTFTKPVERIPLIEAEPHKITPSSNLSRPQYIIRPPGLPPIPTPQVGTPTPVERGVGADNYYNVLDLRRDKGEF